MAQYDVSEVSRAKLIHAAGKLFSLTGIKGTSIRAIAKEAGINSSAIQYHFGGKDGLLDAVFDYASSPWKKHLLKAYVDGHRELLATRAGQIQMISELQKIIFRNLTDAAMADWSRVFFIHMIQREYKRYERLIQAYLQPDTTAFFEVYRAVTGRDDPENAYCCFLGAVCPAFMFSGSPVFLEMAYPSGRLSPGFEQCLLAYTTRSTLNMMFSDQAGQRDFSLEPIS